MFYYKVIFNIRIFPTHNPLLRIRVSYIHNERFVCLTYYRCMSYIELYRVAHMILTDVRLFLPAVAFIDAKSQTIKANKYVGITTVLL